MRTNIDGQPWYREPWPWILMTGPVIVIIAGIATAWIAVVSNDGLVADDYYKQGLAVNQRLQREQKAAELKVSADLMRSGQQIRVLLTNGNLDPVAGLKLKILHPTRAGADQLIDLRPEGQGVYRGELASGLQGRWYVMLEDPAGLWRLQGDWVADGEEPLRLAPGDLQSPPRN